MELPSFIFVKIKNVCQHVSVIDVCQHVSVIDMCPIKVSNTYFTETRKV